MLKSSLGFVAAFIIGFAVVAIVLTGAVLGTTAWLGPNRFSGNDYLLLRNIVLGTAAGGAIGFGSWGSALARKIDFQLSNKIRHLLLGLNPRLPVAVFGAWSTFWCAYVWLGKNNPQEWYDDNVLRFWETLFVPPLLIIGVLVLFKWANSKRPDELA